MVYLSSCCPNIDKQHSAYYLTLGINLSCSQLISLRTLNEPILILQTFTVCVQKPLDGDEWDSHCLYLAKFQQERTIKTVTYTSPLSFHDQKKDWDLGSGLRKYVMKKLRRKLAMHMSSAQKLIF
jgi:hypothetical protein